jgi:hypothetical protein
MLPPSVGKLGNMAVGVMASVRPDQIIVRVVVPKTTYSLTTSFIVRGSLDIYVNHSILLVGVVVRAENVRTGNDTCSGWKVNLKSHGTCGKIHILIAYKVTLFRYVI